MTALALVAAYPAYEAEGWGAGMAAIIATTSWRGEFTDEYFAQPAADPGRFGLPTEDRACSLLTRWP